MAELFRELYSLHIVNYVGIEDFADQLNFLYTAALLSACCSVITLRTYFMRPISCYLPNTFGHYHDESGLHNQVSYVNNYCWTEGTYAVSPAEFRINNSRLLDGGMDRYSAQKIVYYQWVPFVLAIQGVCFCLPRLLWHLISYDRAGTDVGHIISIAKDAVKADGEKHGKLVNHACRMIEQLLDRNTGERRGRMKKLGHRCRNCMSRILPSRLTGSWLILTYFLIKLAYLANAIGQLLAMQRFLQLDSSRYRLLGLSLLVDIAAGRDWQNTMAFPRVGCCAIFMKTAAVGNWQFSQCTLPINMINEKIFIFLWFWMIFVAIATALSLCAWLYRVVNAGVAGKFVKKYLRLADNYEQLRRNGHVRVFLRHCLRHDGTFLLKMIALNCGDLICSEIIQGLWKRFKKRKNIGAAGSGAEDNGVFRLSVGNLPERPSRAAVATARRRRFQRQHSVPSGFRPSQLHLEEQQQQQQKQPLGDQ